MRHRSMCLKNFVDRRNAIRHFITLDASFRLHRGYEGEGRTLDLSATGARLQTDCALPVGCPILLRLQPADSRMIALPAYVRWSRPDKNDRFQAGLMLSPGCPDPMRMLGRDLVRPFL